MAAKKLYYSMGEVAEMFDVTPALIRHWESQFDCIKPHRNKKGNRLFTPEDVEKFKQIYHLVKEKGMTLKGAAKVMKHRKSDDMAQQMQLLERLQKIRAALVEVREELNAGSGEQLIDDVPGEEAEPQVATPAPEQSVVESAQVEASAEEPQEQPKKRVVRRKKKSEEEDKELFPFYEQSLF